MCRVTHAVRLQIGVDAQTREHGAEPDLITLSVGAVEPARLDGRHVSTEVAGGFTGRTVGIQCTVGRVLVRAFGYRPAPP